MLIRKFKSGALKFLVVVAGITGIARRAEANNLKYQNSKFKALGLNRDLGLKKLNTVILESFGREYDENNGMWSEHLLIFASIAASGKNVSKILEIGTFKGETTMLLHSLFPEAAITTLDLPEPVIRESGIYAYSNQGSNSDFYKFREENLSTLRNVKFVAMNSLELTLWTEKFDLIWIDGAHGYPVVAIDIVNAVRLLNETGIGLCDDVYLIGKTSDSIYRSNASIETLSELSFSKLIKYNLILKRLSFKFSNPLTQKYLGFFQRFNPSTP